MNIKTSAVLLAVAALAGCKTVGTDYTGPKPGVQPSAFARGAGPDMPPPGQQVLAQVPSHHNHPIGSRIGIRLELEHLIAFARP